MAETLDTVLKVALGLFGLGLMVFVHELGHFVAARIARIEVEAFSIGWGKALFSRRRGATEYRIAVLPIGGYCKMKGEYELRKAIETKADSFAPEPGSFYAAGPLKRIFVGVMGPLFNLFAAFIIFAVVAMAGYSSETQPNRIILENDLLRASGKPTVPAGSAELAGLKTGDTVIAIDGEPVADFTDIVQKSVLRAGETLGFRVLRDGATLDIPVSMVRGPDGIGLLGADGWGELVIGSVAKGSAAEAGGILVGDRIVAINGVPAAGILDLKRALASKPAALALSVERSGARLEKTLAPQPDARGYSIIGVVPKGILHVVPPVPFFPAIASGFSKGIDTLVQTLRGIASLFSASNPLAQLAGPARITYTIGETALSGADQGIGNGIVTALNFLAFIAIALFTMNLLPIPALDGGMILLFLVEMIRRKLPRPRTIYYYNMTGAVLVFALIALALASDFIHFAG